MENSIEVMEDKAEFNDEQLKSEAVEVKDEIKPIDLEEKLCINNGSDLNDYPETVKNEFVDVSLKHEDNGNLKYEESNVKIDYDEVKVDPAVVEEKHYVDIEEVELLSSDEIKEESSDYKKRDHSYKNERNDDDHGKRYNRDADRRPHDRSERRGDDRSDRRSNERSRRRSGDTKHCKVELEAKLNDCKGKIIFYSKSLQAGVIKSDGQSGSIYIMYHVDNFNLYEISPEKIEGTRVCCDAWLMQKSSYIPYLAAVVWKENEPPAADQKKRILSNPTPNDMDVYQVAEDLGRMLKRERDGSRDKDDRRSHKRHKKTKKRSRSKDRRRSKSDDRYSPDKDRKKHKREHSSERRRRKHGSKERRFREESPDRRHRGQSVEDGGGGYDDSYRGGRGGYRGRRMRGGMPRGMAGRGGPLPAAATGAKPKLAIGRFYPAAF